MNMRMTRVFVAAGALALTLGAGVAVAAQGASTSSADDAAKASAVEKASKGGAAETSDAKDAKDAKAAGAAAAAEEPDEPWEPAWGADLDCALCHADVETDHAKYGVTPHIEAGVTCNDCHNSEELGAFHDGDDEVAITYDEQFCFDCHIEDNPHPDWEALAQLTADSEVAKTNDKQPVNPHAPHPEESSADPLTCAMCHTMHGKSAGVSGCYGCHHSYTFQACADCHDKSK